MTKVFLRIKSEYFGNISDKLKNDTEVYEILAQTFYGQKIKINENTIKCFDEKTDGLFGEVRMPDWTDEDYYMVKNSQMIKSHISNNDDIIIIFRQFDYKFYNSFLKFKSEMNFHLHAVIYTYDKMRSHKDDTVFLRMISNVDKCDSVTVFNLNELVDLKEEHWYWLLPDRYEKKIQESLNTANEIFEDELSEIIRKNDFSKLHSDNKSVFVYNHNANAFENHVLEDFEIVTKKKPAHTAESVWELAEDAIGIPKIYGKRCMTKIIINSVMTKIMKIAIQKRKYAV